MIKTSYLIAFAVAVAAAGWVLSGQLARQDTVTPAVADAQVAAAEQPLPRVRVRDMTAAERVIDISLSARTEAVRIAEVSVQTRGTVAEIFAAKGSFVREGEPLLRLDTEDRQARLAQAKALLRQREIEFNAASKLAKKGFAADTKVAEARALLEEANAAVKTMEIDIGYTTVRAPFDGIVDSRSVEIGDFADIGQAVATIVDLDPILVVGQISERDVTKIEVGEAGSALLIDGQQVPGKIRFIAAAADEKTRTFRVELEVANTDWSVAQGISSELRLPVDKIRAHLVSPAILGLSDDGQIGVKSVNRQGVVEFHPVAIVADGPEGMWLAGLPDKVTLITVGQDFVTAGQRVEAVHESTAEPSS